MKPDNQIIQQTLELLWKDDQLLWEDGGWRIYKSSESEPLQLKTAISPALTRLPPYENCLLVNESVI